VRDRAVRSIAEEDPYAALRFRCITYSLLHDHAIVRRSRQNSCSLLDSFLERCDVFRITEEQIRMDPNFSESTDGDARF